jgi:UDP-N-acetylglucosamine transferase subunit ALG13
VIIQAGFADFRFKYSSAFRMLPFQELEARMAEARIVITHGGPGTIMQARAQGKVPIVVPRQARFGEHVNDHQVDFCKRLAQEGLIVPIYEIQDLKGALLTHAEKEKELVSRGREEGMSRSYMCKRLIDYCR